ncbi:hypothetical protein PENSUB_14113 [Penicillium subrubescens]|uniref:Uncharacterized protein n=1 Tax=Penicillium subrubescens TaxID=1316194 RepID=A0A1Q5UPE9_9EURO|nr:hypothetical protein PENSUB_14113 [Penicillium subrubescens]
MYSLQFSASSSGRSVFYVARLQEFTTYAGHSISEHRDNRGQPIRQTERLGCYAQYPEGKKPLA